MTRRTRRLLTTIEIDVDVVYEVSGRHVRATQLDPEEWPEVEIDAVEVVGHSRAGATRIDLLPALPQALIEDLIESIEKDGGDEDDEPDLERDLAEGVR